MYKKSGTLNTQSTIQTDIITTLPFSSIFIQFRQHLEPITNKCSYISVYVINMKPDFFINIDQNGVY